MDDLVTDSPPGATLLVFTLGAAWESRRRQLLPASRAGLEESLHRACLDVALEAGRAAGCRLEVSSPGGLDLPADVRRRPQSGHGFGSRFRNAARATFAANGGPVVIVGSDVPGLAGSHVGRTLELLKEDPERVVVGPSPDGGFYLLASVKPLDGVLASVRWCCRETLKSLRRALARDGYDVVLLAPLADLDSRRDLEGWLAERPTALLLSWRVLLAALGALLAALRQTPPGTSGPGARRRSSIRVPPLRAPPVPA